MLYDVMYSRNNEFYDALDFHFTTIEVFQKIYTDEIV